MAGDDEVLPGDAQKKRPAPAEGTAPQVAPVAPQPAVPEPPAQAAGPGQNAGAPLVVEIVPPGQGLTPSSLPDALANINTVNDSAAMILLRAGARALEIDRLDLRDSNRELQAQLRGVEKELAERNTQKAVLEHELSFLRHSDRLRGALKTVGGIVGGARPEDPRPSNETLRVRPADVGGRCPRPAHVALSFRVDGE